MINTGFIRVATVSPIQKTANPEFNVTEIIRCAKLADKNKAAIVIFPELSITGASAEDLFFQEHLYQKNLKGLFEITSASENIKATLIVGCYLRINNQLYNCAAIIQQGNICGIVPKMYGCGKWFSDGEAIVNSIDTIELIPDYFTGFGDIVFKDAASELTFTVMVGDDITLPLSHCSNTRLRDAQLIINIDATPATVKSSKNIRDLLKCHSMNYNCATIYASANIHESTTDMVYNGKCMIIEAGKILNESDSFVQDSQITYGDIDYESLINLKQKNIVLNKIFKTDMTFPINMLPLKELDLEEKLNRNLKKNPFIPDNSELDDRCKEIFNIQVNALARRIKHVNAEKLVLGISGGLDSTLALLVSVNAMKLVGKSPQDVVTVTMPGFGTSNATKNNAQVIMDALGTDSREISITEAVMQHFTAIGHDPNIHDVTYENAQARERTQILMDLAGDLNGFVVGTGDLSELALGWCTYNGDHMSMYGVNGDIPKTLIKYVIRWFSDNLAMTHVRIDKLDKFKKALYNIIDTPISPELLPPDENGNIVQKTEDKVGPYILHEFFLYYTIKYGTRPKKLYMLACSAFQDEIDIIDIKKWLHEFYSRFFTQQFKRNCIPDGPKIGSIALSPRGAWNMPSDAEVQSWLNEVDLI